RRVREDVVDDEEAAVGDVRGPPLVVGGGVFVGVAAVDEDEGERGGPEGGDAGGAADQGDHQVRRARAVEGAAGGGEGVHQTQLRVDGLRVVVVPAGLLLLAAAVVVHGEGGDPGGAGRVGEQDRGAAAVGADLQQGQP